MQDNDMSFRLLLAAAILPALIACQAEQAPAPEYVEEDAAWQGTAGGVLVDIDRDGFNKLRLQVIDDGIIRVSATPGPDFSNLTDTLMVVAEPAEEGFTVEQEGQWVAVRTPAASAEVSLESGAVLFRDAGGRLMLLEAERSLGQVSAVPG